MITHDEFQKALKIVNEYKIQIETISKEVSTEVKSIGKFANVNAEMTIWDIDCSVRLLNIIRANEKYLGLEINKFYITIGELSKISIVKFLQCRGAGKSMLQELKKLCFYAGVSLQP
jgi:hypothetical protein